VKDSHPEGLEDFYVEAE